MSRSSAGYVVPGPWPVISQILSPQAGSSGDALMMTFRTSMITSVTRKRGAVMGPRYPYIENRATSRGHRKTRRVSTGFAPIWTSVPAVDPTIAAAWITGGVGALGIAGTVVTAIVGSRNTRRATEATIAAGTATTAAPLTAARDDRLWEKRCAAYEETLTALLHRRMQRRHDLRGFRWD